MKQNHNKTYLKVKVIEGTAVIGIFAGSVCVGILARNHVMASDIGGEFFKKFVGNLFLSGFTNIGMGLAGKFDLWFRDTELYLNAKKEEEFFAKAEANGWTLVKCNYTVEDWDKAAA